MTILADDAFVRFVQGHLGVTVDGVAGARTQAAFLKAIGQTAEPAPALPAPVRSAKSGAELRQGRAGYLVNEIVVHCSATRPDWMDGQGVAAKRAEIRRWHLDRGWRDIGYQWLIDRDGAVAAGRPETEIGAGVVNHNRGVIHVCLIGGHGSAVKDSLRDHFTAAQEAALVDIIRDIRVRTRINRISGHNEHAAKACPGFDVPSALAQLGVL